MLAKPAIIRQAKPATGAPRTEAMALIVAAGRRRFA
jgi:hypothetical protein